MSWTDDRVDLLKKLWTEGYSASQIAAELGGVTRNAVIGKIHRLGMSGRSKPVNANSRARAKPRQKLQSPARTKTASAPVMQTQASSGGAAVARQLDVDAQPSVLHEAEIINITQRISIMELNENTCRWPIGEPGTPEFGYCGKPCGDGPYCEAHAKIAFQSDRRRKKMAG